MRQMLRLGILCLSAWMSLCSAQDVTPEELAVRALYSQFVIGSDVKAIQYGDAPGLLSIRLSNFRIGPLSAIANEPIRDLVTIPSGQILANGSGSWSLNEQKLCTTVYIGPWGPLSVRYGGAEHENWQTPFSGFLKGRAGYDTFSGFTAEVFSQGQARRYKALALFSTDRKSLSIVDYVLGGDTIVRVGQERDFPKCLAIFPGAVHPRSRAIAENYVESQRIAGRCVTEPYTGLCCDPAGGKCGLPQRR